MPSPGAQLRADLPRLEFTFVADANVCVDVGAQIMAFIAEHCPLHEAESEVDLALQEALANAVVHGCKNDPLKTIFCEVTCDKDMVEIVVRDPGPGFDPAKVPDPLSDEGRARFSGRGVHLIRSLMDEVTFAHNGAEIRMRKRRPAAS